MHIRYTAELATALIGLAIGFALLVSPEAPAAAEEPADPTTAVSTSELRTRAGELLGERRAARWRALLADSTLLPHLQAIAPGPREGLMLLGAGVGGVALLGLLHRRRGHGELAVSLLFPDAIEGDFVVSIARRSRKPDRAQRSDAAPAGLARPDRYTRIGVRRETQFARLAPGCWFVTIQGPLRAPESEAILASVLEEIPVEIARDECQTVEHALPEVEVPVGLRILWDRRPARDVGLMLRDRPESLRYASQGVARFPLPPGRHELVIGAGDRVVERTIDVDGYEPKRVSVDLGAGEGIVFKGCPPAVASFLQGDLGDAARALERDGQTELAHELVARLHQEQGQSARAAERLEQAGRDHEAAELWRELEQFERAALLYQKTGDPGTAAEMYEAAGDWRAAAEAHAATPDWDATIRCWERAGDGPRLVDALESKGDLIRAAALATELDDRARSFRLLQQIGPGHPDHGRATELLALAFEQEGHLDLAAEQIELRILSLPPDEPAPQLELHLAELFEKTGELARALSVLERLRDREPTLPELATMIEGLRKQLSTPLHDQSGATHSLPSGATAFVAAERYEILEEIGRGGMGLVYRARDRRLGREVALKRLPETLRGHPTAVSLFLGEAQAAARMNHPNIVTLYDADQEDGVFFITMELLEGLPLDTILAKRRRFGPLDAARLGVQACAGLQFAHTQGIVHRDIKTANLFITRDKVLKIMDFGLAKMMEVVRGHATVIAGTPFYMAPEQASGGAVDPRTDLYALGVTLFELSTGRLPFSGEGVAEQHRNAPPPIAGREIPDYPAALAELIRTMMAKTPAERPASANEVARTLARIIEEESTA